MMSTSCILKTTYGSHSTPCLAFALALALALAFAFASG